MGAHCAETRQQLSKADRTSLKDAAGELRHDDAFVSWALSVVPRPDYRVAS